MTQLLPPKKEVALALLERSNVDVYLDPRAKGVVVPPQFRKEPRLILKIGLNMPVPIPDLRLDDDSMSCTLSFNRSPFYCVVPWTSVFAMVGEDGRGMVWPDDVPQELAVKVVDPSEQERSSGQERPDAPSASSSTTSTNGAAASGRRGEKAVASRPAGKRKKKKEEGPPRPVLVAVPSAASAPSGPSAAASSPSAPATSARSRPSSSSSSSPSSANGNAPSSRRPPSVPVPAHGADGAPSPASGRPKRELPPYLRVVK